MNYYDFMDKMDKFCLKYSEDYDFREINVHVNKILGKEILFIKNKDGKIIENYVLN